MKKWIGYLTTACLMFSTVRADEASLDTDEIIESQQTPIEATIVSPPGDEQAPKHVGKAASDSSSAGRRGEVGKYVLAASAVVIGVTALILVSRHGGHH